MKIFKSNKIRDRVMQAIEQKISQAEVAYEEGCKNADALYRADIKAAENRRDIKKQSLEDTAVDSIIGKFFNN